MAAILRGNKTPVIIGIVAMLCILLAGAVMWRAARSSQHAEAPPPNVAGEAAATNPAAGDHSFSGQPSATSQPGPGSSTY